MSRLDQFNKHKAELGYAKAWYSLIGDRFQGGGGGVGKIVKLDLTAQVYHQPRNGDKNYHDMPTVLSDAMENVIVREFGTLYAKAIAEMELHLKDLGKAAVDEHLELMAEAGLATPPA